MLRYQDHAIFLLRLATGANFLSAVASRLNLWGSQSSGWKNFLAYTAEVNAFAPPEVIPFLAITATVLEVLFGVLLIAGYKTRMASMGAGMLTLIFALAMSSSFGIKSVFDYSVFVDSASAFVLATAARYRWSIDENIELKATQSKTQTV